MNAWSFSGFLTVATSMLISPLFGSEEHNHFNEVVILD